MGNTMNKPHILYFTANKSNQKNFEKEFGTKGFALTFASSGKEGLEFLAAHKVDVALFGSDISDMSGLEALNHLNRLAIDIPFILLSNNGSIPQAVEAIKQGAYDFIPNTFQFSELEKTITKAIKENSIKREFQQTGVEDKRIQALEKKAISLGKANIDMLAAQEQLEEKNLQMETLLNELSTRKDELQAIFDASPSAIIMINSEDKITAANKQVHDFFGIRREDILNKNFDQFIESIKPCFKDFEQFLIFAEEMEEYCDECDVGEFDMHSIYQFSVEISQPNTRFILPVTAIVKSTAGEYQGRIWIYEDITQAKQADELLHTIAEASPIPFVVTRLSDGEIIYANKPLAELVGYKISELIGQHALDFYANPGDRERLLEKLKVEGQALHQEIQVRKSDGEVIWMIFSLTTGMVGSEKVVIGGLYDINERRRAEEALRESEERFRQLTENISEAFWIYDIKTERVIYISPAFEDITGLKREEVLENFEKGIEIIHPDDRDRILSVLNKRAVGEFDEEYRIIKPGNNVRWVRERAFPIFNDAGELYRICGVSEDFTYRKAAEENLRLYRKIFMNSNDTIAILDKDARILEVNPAAQTLFGYSPDEIVGKSTELFIGKEVFAETLQQLPDKGNYSFRKEIVAQTKSGKQIIVELSAFPILNDEDDVIYRVGFSRDITQRKQAEEALRTAHDELEIRVQERTAELANANSELQKAREGLEIRVQERTAELAETLRDLKVTQSQLVQSEKMAALGTLVAGIAHEINTPVGAINSMHNTLVRAVEKLKQIYETEFPDAFSENPKLARTMKVIEDANRVIASGSERVTTIVKRLRSFARLDEAALKEADIHEGLEDTLVLIHHEIKHHINVVKNYGELPLVSCFPGKLNQVFLNLLINAKQAVGEEGTVTISTTHKNGNIHVSIADNGVGIPQENLQKIFDPGFTTKGVGVGTGLGLSIVYQIVREDHKGDITVESEVGKGTTFTVSIPDNLDELVEHT